MDLICGHWHAPAPAPRQPSLLFIRAAALCFLFYYLMWMTLTAMRHTFKCSNFRFECLQSTPGLLSFECENETLFSSTGQEKIILV